MCSIPSYRTWSRWTGVSNASRARIAIFAAASRPSTSSDGSASAYPSRCASASASSNVIPVRAISVRMKLVVPLTIPWTRSILAPASDSWSTRITGTTPATAPSKRSCTPFAAGRLPQLLAVLREQLLVGGDDVAARARSPAARSRAPGRSRRSARRSGPSARAARRTSPGCGVTTPTARAAARSCSSIRSACSGSSAANAEPDGAVTEQPDPEGRCAPSVDVTGGQVVVGLAPDDQARASPSRQKITGGRGTLL